MNLFVSLLFPIRLAWRQLIFNKAKFISAICGVLFASILVFMQLGFRDTLYTCAASAPGKIKGDLFLIHKQTEELGRPVTFNRNELARTLGHPETLAVYPMYMSLGYFKNSQTRIKRTLLIYGFDPAADILDSNDIHLNTRQLFLTDTALFDIASRPEFGAVQTYDKHGEFVTEINDYKIKIVGLFKMGTSFTADGNLATSDLNFFRLFPLRKPNQIDLGIIKLRPGSNISQVQHELQPVLNDNVDILTHDQLIRFEQLYWENSAPIGYIFGFGAFMGLVVGMVIVYQILFTDITNHMNEYATLKAMGYKNIYFMNIVFSSAGILGAMGFIPGFFISLGLYRIAEDHIFMPMLMSPAKVVTVFFFIIAMCACAGMFAMRKLKAADPADLF
ncbi:MAG: ABC transporter permease DevC [Gammaproteobacteria bacterium]